MGAQVPKISTSESPNGFLPQKHYTSEKKETKVV